MSECIEAPEKPLSSDCCGGGACCPCVWDTYYEKYREWQDHCRRVKQREADAQLASLAHSNNSTQPKL